MSHVSVFGLKRRRSRRCSHSGSRQENSPERVVDSAQKRRGLPRDPDSPPPATPSDMLQSQCVLDHASTGKEGSSAKKKRDRQAFRKEEKQSVSLHLFLLVSQSEATGSYTLITKVKLPFPLGIEG